MSKESLGTRTQKVLQSVGVGVSRKDPGTKIAKPARSVRTFPLTSGKRPRVGAKSHVPYLGVLGSATKLSTFPRRRRPPRGDYEE